ncbi:MAG: TIGR01777 family oxidoreductase [Polyangiaceae bacterium]|nr:TIGR01777 family oxidoreductase [Polyangiaceae bacterium]
MAEGKEAVVVSGGTGFIGQALIRTLQERGHREIYTFSRQPSRATLPPGVDCLAWSPGASELSAQAQNALRKSSWIFNLAGAPVVGQRWTPQYREELRASRLDPTNLLRKAILALAQEEGFIKKRFVSMSGIGFYGDRPKDDPVSETSEVGRDFLAELCVDWESASQPTLQESAECEERFSSADVVNTRMGIVLDKDGGALAKILPPLRAFLGGPIGTGQQGVSWIAREDAAKALIHCAESHLQGPVNICSPQPVSNRELMTTLGRHFHRPSRLPVPPLALKALFGEGATPLLTGQFAKPTKLLSDGFEFHHPDLKGTIQAIF